MEEAAQKPISPSDDPTLSETVKIHEQLHEDELRTLIEAASEAIVIIDQNGRIVLANDKTAEIFGYDKDNLVGQQIEILLPERLQSVHVSHRADYFADPRTRPMGRGFDLWGQHEDGSEFPVEVGLSAVKTEDNSLAMALISDITERKQAENALQNQLKRLETLNKIGQAIVAAESPEMIAQVTVRQIPHLAPCQQVNIIFFNPETQTSWLNVTYPDDDRKKQPGSTATVKPLATILEELKSGQTLIIDDLLKFPRSTHFTDSLIAQGYRSALYVPILSQDELLIGSINLLANQPHNFNARHTETIQQIAVSLAISIQQTRLHWEIRQYTKELEELISERTAELQTKNEDLQQFAFVASHDLQEPLRSVTGYLQFLERRHKDQLNSDAQELITRAVAGAKRMQTLINDLLAFSRIGTQEEPFAPTDCQTTLDQVQVNLKQVIEENNAVITHDSLPTVMADATQLQQLFQNIISNAIKYRSDQPPTIHIGVERRQQEWLFAVQDNGIGIEAQYVDLIFLVFQRLHSRSRYPGTGIGLAICKRIVERHGGYIWVESQPGQGSTFFFTLPTNQEAK